MHQFLSPASGGDYLLSILLILLALLLTQRRFRLFDGRWAIVGISLFLGARYLYWRGVYTLNTADGISTVISLALYSAEVYGLLSMILFYVQLVSPTRRAGRPPATEPPPMVDLFVTIYNESPDILYRTLVGCKAMDYPAGRIQVYVLDDGPRDDVKQMAAQLGCRYMTRKDREHAKAGNLNYGLTQSSGEFVAVLDCDHVPVRTFLKETIGFFEDSKVAIVQTPHYFYNPDSYQRNHRLEKEIVNEQDLFFYVIQPGRDGANASFFAGSGGIFRRSALEQIGGFQVKTITEDLHTSMTLHANGYRSIYLAKTLTAGLAPESYRSYIRQRQRWARGGVQVFLLDNPLIRPGLTLLQRIHYFASIFYFFHGWPRLIFLMAPLSYLLIGYPPLVSSIPVLLNFFVPYYVTSMMAFNRISGNFRNPFWSDVYEGVMCFAINWANLQTLWSPRKIQFQVTPKGERFENPELAWSYVVPHLVLLGLLLGGLAVGGYRAWHHSVEVDATVLSVAWTIYNLLILVAAIVVARERPQKRTAPRLVRQIACELEFAGRRLAGKTTDLSETGLSMTLDESVLLPPRVGVLLISDFGEVTEIEGEVIRNDSTPDGGVGIGIRFIRVGESQRQGLIRQMYSSPSSWERAHESTSGTWRSFRHLATALFRAMIRDRILRRFSHRVERRFVCELVEGDCIERGVTENIGHTGILIRTDAVLPIHKVVTIHLIHEGRVVFRTRGEVVRKRISGGPDRIYGIRFLEATDLDLTSLG